MIGRTLTPSPSPFTKIILEDFPSGIFPSFPRKTFHLKFLRFDSAQSRILNPIPIRSSSINVSQVNIEDAEIEAIDNSPRKTVRVRLQLRKECVFGEHFFILGDDPVFGGLWDPENALPLNWSDGHVWTVDLDLPVGRLVEFKFILKAKTGEILWQPGPNRVLETWETNKTIRRCEDWENADLQMMIEEDFVPINQEEKQSSVANLDMSIVAEDATHLEHSARLSTTDISSSSAKEEEEVLCIVQQKSSEEILVNVGYISDDSDENLISNSQCKENMETSNGALTAQGVGEGNVIKEAMFIEEEGPVLVPGLIPLSDLEYEEVNESAPHVSVEAINEGKAETFPEVGQEEETKRERKERGKVKAISVNEKAERRAVKGVEKQVHYNEAEEGMLRLETEPLGTPDVLLEKDIQWGRRTLYKLLSNFRLF